MNYWEKAIAKDSSIYRELHKGLLLGIGEKGQINYSFNYAVIQSRKYTTTFSSFPGEFIEPTETIYTSDVDLPFTKGSSIKLSDKIIMTIKDIESVLNENTGALRGLILYLDGGLPNEFA